MVMKTSGTRSSRGCELKVLWPRKWVIKFTIKFSVRIPNVRDDIS
jgi:hypothetical protein